MNNSSELKNMSVEKINKLAESIKINLSPAQAGKIAVSFKNGLAGLDELAWAKLENIEPDFGQPLWAASTRPDVAGPAFNPENIVNTAPEAKPPYFVVPRVL